MHDFPAVADSAGGGDCRPLASVVIVTYDHMQALDDNLRALAAQTVDNFEVLVVDNNETLDISALVARYPVRHVKLGKNRGLCAGRNAGVELARADIVVFLDDDAIPAADLVEAHVSAFRDNNIYGLRGKSIPKRYSVYNFLAAHYDLGDDIAACCINLEANCSFNKRVLSELGGFNPNLKGGGGHEGLELTFKGVKKYGDKGKFVYYPKAVVYHDYASSFSKYFIKQLRHARNEALLEYEHPGMFDFIRRYPSRPAPRSGLSRQARLHLEAARLATKAAAAIVMIGFGIKARLR
ncbi:MAG: hypothetical protein A2V88_13215 [Elusimicrobia bacterium RBG_16_66_12]|nr:MAG: hypothetical protein A2V88_13215 [Elusimicrobia bacterium RBG_16_66_12]